MPRKPKQIIAAALPAEAYPEIEELLRRFSGQEKTRSNVVMVRLTNQALTALDELVESGIFGSRSEAAAFLVGAGIEAQKNLLREASKHTAEIKKVRQRLRKAVAKVMVVDKPKKS